MKLGRSLRARSCPPAGGAAQLDAAGRYLHRIRRFESPGRVLVRHRDGKSARLLAPLRHARPVLVARAVDGLPGMSRGDGRVVALTYTRLLV